jgi:DNA-binding response OmpR family regulator
MKPVILVVEDDELAGRAYQLKLGQAGYQVEWARNGAEALEMIRKNRPDLVILDLILPNINGFQFLEEVKKDEKLKDIRVLVVSNLGQEEDMQKAMSLGASDYMVKVDVRIEDVVEKVDEMTGRKAA